MTRLEPSKRVPAYWPLEKFPLAIVAQSPGRKEVEEGFPLVGKSGELLRDCFEKAKLPWEKCLRTNLIGFRPPGDDFTYFCRNKETCKMALPGYDLPQVSQGKYLHPDWFDEIERLQTELETYDPNLIIACGNEALWALCGVTGITKYQGAIMECTLVPGLKVLPVFHPAAALREYSLKVLITQSLFKARHEVKFREIVRPNREIWIYPTVEDLYEWEKQESVHGPLLSVDIETTHGHIDCIGLSFQPSCSLVVPFWSDLRPGHSYWRTSEEEVAAWDFIEHLLETYEILGQNYAYFDFWRILGDIGIFTRKFRHCTMTAHHAYQPELPKDLGFLTSSYCNDAAYKTIRPRGAKSTKRED